MKISPKYSRLFSINDLRGNYFKGLYIFTKEAINVLVIKHKYFVFLDKNATSTPNRKNIIPKNFNI